MAGIAAYFAWLLLSLLTIGGSAIGTTLGLPVNLFMGAAFAAVSAFLFWRSKRVTEMFEAFPEDPVIQAFARTELILNAMALAVGVLLVSAASYRLFVEEIPVFG